jgi:hypothetical protein
MTLTEPHKRKYKRLSASEWAEARARWEAGNSTLEELGDHYGVSRRGLQSHFRKHGVIRGAAGAELARAIKETVLHEELGDKEVLTRRAKAT